MSSYFRLLHSRSTKMLSMHRPLPSRLILMAWAFSTPVKSVLVNWLPWARASARTGGALSLAIEDLRPAEPAQRLFQGLDAEVGVQRVRNSPSQNRPRVPVHDGDQVDEAPGQRDVGDLPLRVAQGPAAPDLVDPVDRQAAQEIRILDVFGRRLAGIGTLVDGHQTHQPHQALNPLAVDG